MEEDRHFSSFKNKLRHSFCFSCCFRRRTNHHVSLYTPPSLPSPSDNSPTVIWVKTKGPHFHSIKEKCRSMFGIFGTMNKKHGSADFRYDPLSYALNFEDGFDYDDDAPLKNFTSRLPPSNRMATAVS